MAKPEYFTDMEQLTLCMAAICYGMGSQVRIPKGDLTHVLAGKCNWRFQFEIDEGDNIMITWSEADK